MMVYFALRLQPEMWSRIIQHLRTIDDVCSLAMVNKYFYKLVKLDFKQLCYDHVVYRLKGETWSYAFSEYEVRADDTSKSKRLYQRSAVCCPFTGKIAMQYCRGYVVLTNIDFGLKEFTMLNFTDLTDGISTVNIINRGKQLLVGAPSFVIVYDLHDMAVVSTHEQAQTLTPNYQVLYETYVFDFYSLKEFSINPKFPNGNIYYINMYDKQKYIGVHTVDNKLVLINNETDERHQICEWTQPMDVYVITENNSVVILSSRVGSRVYSILRRKFVFDEPIPDRDPFTFYEPRDADWVVFNSNALFNKATSYDGVRAKAFNNKVEDKKSIINKHHISMLGSVSLWPKQQFYYWVSRLHIAKKKVLTINAVTGSQKYWKIYPPTKRTIDKNRFPFGQ